MKSHHISANGCARNVRCLTLVAAVAASMFATDLMAQAPVAASAGVSAQLSAEQMEGLVGRIALYPDDLVAIILPAATNPLQVVQADRFLDKRKTDPKLALDDKWDDAVKSLVNYPEVIKSMSSDLDWTSALGEAVVSDQAGVLEAIQVFRRKTQAAGNLKSDPKQTVVVEKEVIRIVPADPQVIYVPQYNPTTVVVYGGYSSWGYYPSPYPVYYYPYPPGAALATGLIWGAAIGAAWHGGHYATHYGGGGNTININRNTNVNTGNINRGGAGNSATQWKSNKQPGQVSGSVGKTPSQGARMGDNRSSGAAGNAGGAGRASTQPAGGGAFSGANSSGRQTQMDSSRGASSRSSTAGAGASSAARSSPSARTRQAPSGGGGARAGGGGGGRGGRR